ncbi:MAG: hypothetical protein ACM3JC_10680 [Rudaea sp.]
MERRLALLGALLDESAEQPVDVDFSGRTATWRDAGRELWEGDVDESDARAEVDRFLRDHRALEEAEMV